MYAQPAVDPETTQPSIAAWRRLRVAFELPMQNRYSAWSASLIEETARTGKA
jgi:hypothetical protein